MLCFVDSHVPGLKKEDTELAHLCFIYDFKGARVKKTIVRLDDCRSVVFSFQARWWMSAES
jgi:hypothetical protein